MHQPMVKIQKERLALDRTIGEQRMRRQDSIYSSILIEIGMHAHLLRSSEDLFSIWVSGITYIVRLALGAAFEVP